MCVCVWVGGGGGGGGVSQLQGGGKVGCLQGEWIACREGGLPAGKVGCLQGGRVACRECGLPTGSAGCLHGGGGGGGRGCLQKECGLPAESVGCLQGGWVACREGELPARRMHGCREDGWGCREGRWAGLILPDVPRFLPLHFPPPPLIPFLHILMIGRDHCLDIIMCVKRDLGEPKMMGALPAGRVDMAGCAASFSLPQIASSPPHAA